jgi:hypothetical protein
MLSAHVGGALTGGFAALCRKSRLNLVKTGIRPGSSTQQQCFTVSAIAFSVNHNFTFIAQIAVDVNCYLSFRQFTNQLWPVPRIP